MKVKYGKRHEFLGIVLYFGLGQKRVTVARHDIKIMIYNNESSFSFEKYSRYLKIAFTALATYEQPKSEREKVEILCSQIKYKKCYVENCDLCLL